MQSPAPLPSPTVAERFNPPITLLVPLATRHPPPPPPPPAKRGSLWITKATTITKKFQGFWNTVAGTQNKADTFFIVSHSLCHALSWNIRLKEDLERSNCPSFCLQVSLYFNHWRQLIIIFRKKWQQQNYTGWQSLQSVHVAGHFQIPRETQQWGLATFLL